MWSYQYTIIKTAINLVVSLDSVDGGECRFEAHRAHCGVQPGIPQQLSTMWKGTFSARQGRVVGEVRAVKANYTIAGEPASKVIPCGTPTRMSRSIWTELALSCQNRPSVRHLAYDRVPFD